MRIAVCLSGLLRTYLSTYENFKKNLLAPLSNIAEVDIFISTWNTISSEYAWCVEGKNVNEKLDREYFQKVQKMYNPRRILVEDFNRLKPKFLLKNFNPALELPKERIKDGVFTLLPMWFKIHSCNELKKQQEQRYKFRYSYVVRTRFDIRVDPASLQLLRHPLTLFVGDEYCAKQEYCRDLFACSSSHNMDIYSNMYLHLRDYVTNENYESEKVLFKYLRDNMINVNWYPGKMNLERLNKVKKYDL